MLDQGDSSQINKNVSLYSFPNLGFLNSIGLIFTSYEVIASKIISCTINIQRCNFLNIFNNKLNKMQHTTKLFFELKGFYKARKNQ